MTTETLPIIERKDSWNTGEEALFSRDLRRRYTRLFFTPATISFLLAGVLLNAVRNYLVSQWFSSFEMLLGFMDFFMILLIITLARFFQHARRSSFFQDMLLTGAGLNQTLDPLRWVLFGFLVADAFLEISLQSVLSWSGGIPLLFYLMMFVTFVIASRPLAELLLLMNARAYSLVVQVVVTIVFAAGFYWAESLLSDLLFTYFETLLSHPYGAFLARLMEYPNSTYSGYMAALVWSWGVALLGISVVLALFTPLLRRGIARSAEKLIS